MKRDDVFWKELTNGPFPHKNFNELLKREIRQKLDRKAPPHRLWYKGLALAAAVMLFTSFNPILNVDLANQPPDGHLAASQPEPAGASVDPIQRPKTGATQVQSVLLLGLRTDRAGGGEADYRTLLIGDVNGRLQTAAEGPGILAPSGEDFWQVSAGSQRIYAHPANEKNKALPSSGFPGSKLLFVGNRYLSYSENTGSGEHTWTLDYRKAASGAGAKPVVHTRLQDVTSSTLTDDQWSIARTLGGWTVRTPDGGQPHLALPLTPELVSYDSLVCSWGEIKQAEPAAIDAISSPDGDMVAIFTPTELHVYAYNGQLEEKAQLTIALHPGEKMIMDQWAGAGFAQDWMYQVKRFLKIN